MTKACIVAAPATGAGKTTIALGLMAALKARGLTVQPFKIGPDFIDPAYHSKVCGRTSINLDAWMTSELYVCEAFHRYAAGADVAIIEGAMGLFDGAGSGDERGSAAHLAKLLRVPVLLVADVGGAAASAGAVVFGCTHYDPEVPFAGVVFNRVGGAEHLRTLEGALSRGVSIPMLGTLPYDDDLTLPERHLGLVSVYERALPHMLLVHLVTHTEAGIDIDRLLERSADFEITALPQPASASRVRIGIAQDEAFCFYYEDNLRHLREAGAVLVPFSPLHHRELPVVNGLYIGGGFPEEFAPRLSENAPMVRAVREFRGPIYAECGGLMYLCEEVADRDGIAWPMAGRVPGSIAMTATIQGFGYTEAALTRDCVLGPHGMRLRGHRFHWSRWQRIPETGWGIFESSAKQFGYADARTMASYFHAHFGSCPAAASAFVEASARA